MPRRPDSAADRRLAEHLFAVLRSGRPNGLRPHDDFELLPEETKADFERLAGHVRLGKHKHVLTEWGAS